MITRDCICENISVSPEGTLLFAGHNTVELAEKYGTPLYLMDEDRIRERCRTYLDGVKAAFGDKGQVLYASKAASFKRIYEIMKEEGMGIDVVSAGEIATARKAGFPLERAYFHSNNKTDGDIRYGINCGVGYFVVDGPDELRAIQSIAESMGRTQAVLLRITPGIDPHTYEAVATGKVDCKFGSAIETGQAREITELALSLPNIRLAGFHCHVGSQVFDSSVYVATVDVMLQFLADMRQAFGYEAEQLDLGGGYGVRYTAEDPTIDIAAAIAEVGARVREKVAEHGISMPLISFEPGRSIVADAGMTLYTVGSVKKLPGYKNYVSVDGGMTDNPRFALYGSAYTVAPAARMLDERDMTASVAGRCCESGDILQEDVALPADIRRGDFLAFMTTGAYQYSMASNYNRIPRPAVVMLHGGKHTLAVRRETLDDLLALDE